jgi:hypothetical protein
VPIARKTIDAAGSKDSRIGRAPCADAYLLFSPDGISLCSFGMLATFAAGGKPKRPAPLCMDTKDDTLTHEDVWQSETSQIGNL